MLPPPPIPALLNNKWILSVWWRSATSSRNRSTCVRSAPSAMCVVTRSPCGNPAASHSLCVSARPVGEKSHIATLQASATSWRTNSRPIPLPPPVTTAVLPANSVIASSLACRRRSRYGPPTYPLRWWRGIRDLRNERQILPPRRRRARLIAACPRYAQRQDALSRAQSVIIHPRLVASRHEGSKRQICTTGKLSGLLKGVAA